MRKILFYYLITMFTAAFFLLNIITNETKSFAFQVQLNEPGVATTNHGEKLYLMDFSYSFPGKNNIYLDNVGTIPPTGTLKYFSEDKTLLFRRCRDCSVVKAATHWGKYEDLGNLEIPREGEYSEKRQHHDWIKPPEFSSCLFDTLSKFGKDSIAHQRDNISYFRTDWFHLKNLPKNLKGRVSFIFSCPSEPQTDKFKFQVGKLILESRAKVSEFRIAENDNIVQAAGDLQYDLIKALMKLKGK